MLSTPIVGNRGRASFRFAPASQSSSSQRQGVRTPSDSQSAWHHISWPSCAVRQSSELSPNCRQTIVGTVAGAADAKESTAIRETREAEGKFLQNSAVRLLTWEAINGFAGVPSQQPQGIIVTEGAP
jgi:hypothetical protein